MSGPLQILFKDTYCVDCRRELRRGTELSMGAGLNRPIVGYIADRL